MKETQGRWGGFRPRVRAAWLLISWPPRPPTVHPTTSAQRSAGAYSSTHCGQEVIISRQEVVIDRQEVVIDQVLDQDQEQVQVQDQEVGHQQTRSILREGEGWVPAIGDKALKIHNIPKSLMNE